MKVVLTVAGTDPSSAAGIQADLQVIAEHGHHGVSVVTAVLAQDTGGVRRVDAMDVDVVAAQLDAVLDDFDVAAVKVGLVPTDALVGLVAERVGHLPVVWDPVLVSGDGVTKLFTGTANAFLAALAVVDVATPNALEAAALTGLEIPDRVAAHRAARALAERARGGVLLKAGHLPHTDTIVDVWADANGVRDLEALAAIDVDVRGTGCHLSTAIASGLAAGLPADGAVREGRRYLNDLLHTRVRQLGRGRRVIAHAR